MADNENSEDNGGGAGEGNDSLPKQPVEEVYGGGSQERFHAQSALQLYGRHLTDLKLEVDSQAPGNNDLVYHQLSKQIDRPDPMLARIYCYVFEGVVYTLPSTFIMLVHGEGHAPSKDGRFDRAVTDLDLPPDIRVWYYDKEDYSVRLESKSGPLSELLLANRMFSSNGNGQMNGAGQFNGAGQMNAGGHSTIACRGGKF